MNWAKIHMDERPEILYHNGREMQALPGNPAAPRMKYENWTTKGWGQMMHAVLKGQDEKLHWSEVPSPTLREGDVLLGISTSGNAKNVLMAMRAARQLGMHTVALTGLGGGKMGEEADLLLDVPEKETYRVQEEHIRLYHQLCARVEAHFFKE